jgi:hypothetical protein
MLPIIMPRSIIIALDIETHLPVQDAEWARAAAGRGLTDERLTPGLLASLWLVQSARRSTEECLPRFGSTHAQRCNFSEHASICKPPLRKKWNEFPPGAKETAKFRKFANLALPKPAPSRYHKYIHQDDEDSDVCESRLDGHKGRNSKHQGMQTWRPIEFRGSRGPRLPLRR